ncbi:MAG: helix-turn-helix domain-containing protein [Chromatiales bacterium]|jgi:Ner family transcriptional regulator|nr:helix-turn-helix domain-containing protein [Chromatiales bacterium]
MPRLDRTTKELLRDPQKRRAWVIYRLSLNGLSLASLARGAGVRRQTLYQVFATPYPRMETIIARALNLPPQELWPERYAPDGAPFRRRGRPKKSTYKEQHFITGANRRNAADCRTELDT